MFNAIGKFASKLALAIMTLVGVGASAAYNGDAPVSGVTSPTKAEGILLACGGPGEKRCPPPTCGVRG